LTGFTEKIIAVPAKRLGFPQIHLTAPVNHEKKLTGFTEKIVAVPAKRLGFSQIHLTAPMNHVKKLRAGPPEMPLRNWYNCGIKHFKMNSDVR